MLEPNLTETERQRVIDSIYKMRLFAVAVLFGVCSITESSIMVPTYIPPHLANNCTYMQRYCYKGGRRSIGWRVCPKIIPKGTCCPICPCRDYAGKNYTAGDTWYMQVTKEMLIKASMEYLFEKDEWGHCLKCQCGSQAHCIFGTCVARNCPKEFQIESRTGSRCCSRSCSPLWENKCKYEHAKCRKLTCLKQFLPKGECCPVCACEDNNGQKYKAPSRFRNDFWNRCNQCWCKKRNGIDRAYCQENTFCNLRLPCPKAYQIEPKDSCCKECSPKWAPKPRPTFPPPPTFSPRPQTVAPGPGRPSQWCPPSGCAVWRRGPRKSKRSD